MKPKFCTLCGAHIIQTSAEKWAREFRAIWIRGNNLDDVKVSGVAARDWNDRNDISSIVPVNPIARYDDREVDDDGFAIEDDDEHEPDVEISIVNIVHPNPPPEWRWGFLFHDVCKEFRTEG
ncbi:uncharacterized protein FFB14_04454 [Fusarium fujikuroi]|nr:uncharacterized protein FFB14_04454 [Fusarium fujikuroi]